MKTIEITTVVLSQKQRNTLDEAGFICGEIVKCCTGVDVCDVKEIALRAMSDLARIVQTTRTE